MIRILLLFAAAVLVAGVVGCGDPPNANPTVSSDSKGDPRLQPVGRPGDTSAPASGPAKAAGAVNQP